MPALTPRQIAVRAQEAASQLVAALDREGLVAHFLNSYAREGKRPGRTADPERYRELLAAIRREALLVMVLQIESQAPALLGIRSPRRTPAQSRLLDLFREEFFVALGRTLAWSDEDFDSFCSDLDLFRKLYASTPRPSSRASSAYPQGPFVDRCALLLDSAMIDQARRAAAKFEAELAAVSSSRLKKIFSTRQRP